MIGETPEHSEAENAWQQKENEVAMIPNIESGAKEIVTAFSVSEIPTSQSCEGHLYEEGAGVNPPYVEISAPNQPEERFIGQEKIIPEVSKKYGVAPEDVRTMLLHSAPWEEFENSKETPEYKKWREENKAAAGNTESLLKNFYRNRTTADNVSLIINEKNAGQFEITNAGGNEVPQAEAKQRLAQYQNEMNAFAQFLKEKYFESNKNQMNITEMDNPPTETGDRITEAEVTAQKNADQKELARLREQLGLQKKYLVGAKINPDGSIDYSQALEMDTTEKKEFEPVVPRGWTFLKHGTNLVHWGEQTPYNSDTIVLKKNLSVISQEDFKHDQEISKERNTTKTYGIVAKPKGMSDEEFKDKNKPFEIRIMFYQNHVNYKYDPEYKKGLDEETIDKIKKYYYLNAQHGRHPLVPSKEILIKLGQTKEDEKDVFYFVPESVSGAYSKESGVKIKLESE